MPGKTLGCCRLFRGLGLARAAGVRGSSPCQAHASGHAPGWRSWSGMGLGLRLAWPTHLRALCWQANAMVSSGYRTLFRRRPYRVECTGSLSTSEVKQHRARLVLGWGTAWEDLRVLSALSWIWSCPRGRRQGHIAVPGSRQWPRARLAALARHGLGPAPGPAHTPPSSVLACKRNGLFGVSHSVSPAAIPCRMHRISFGLRS